MWSRRLILSASALGSITNVATPFFLAQFIGLAHLAIWVSYKAATQLFISLFPNCVNSLLYLSKYKGIDRAHIIKRGYFTVFIIFSIESVTLLAVSLFVEEVRSVVFALLVYLAAFQFSGFQGIVVRSWKRSDILIKASVLDVCLSLLVLLSLVGYADFTLFILLSAIKEFLRGIYMMWLCLDSFKEKAHRKAPESIISKYKYMHLSRGFLQVLSQLGDRIMYPVVFGFSAAGQAALGSSVGMLIALLSSSAFTWALPRTMEGHDMSRWLIGEWFKLVFFIVIGAVAAYFLAPIINSKLSLFSDDAIRLDSMFIAAFVFASISSANFLSFGLSRKRLANRSYLFCHSAIIFSSYCCIALAFALGLSSVVSVYLGCFCGVLGILIVNWVEVNANFKRLGGI